MKYFTPFLILFLSSSLLFALSNEDGEILQEKRGHITVTVLTKPNQTYIDKASRIYELAIIHNGVDTDNDGIFELPRGTETIVAVELKIKKIDGTIDTAIPLNGKKVSVEISRGIITPIPQTDTDDKGVAQFTYTAPNETVHIWLRFQVDKKASKRIEFLLI